MMDWNTIKRRFWDDPTVFAYAACGLIGLTIVVGYIYSVVLR